MMEFKVIKIGAVMLDVLHAYGLAILLTHVFDNNVNLLDRGTHYLIRLPDKDVPHFSANFLYQILPLPSLEQLDDIRNIDKGELSLAVMDGLLAACFTMPGVRCASVNDVSNLIGVRPQIGRQAHKKLARVIEQWTIFIKKISHTESNWVQEMLEAYTPTSLTMPIVTEKRKNMRGLTMPLDPAFSLTNSRWISDGLLTRVTNTSLDGTHFGVLLSYIGAAYCLRAQRVNQNLVNYYLPIPQNVTLSSNSIFPTFYQAERSATNALLYTWIGFWLREEEEWSGWAYQILQTQRVQQSISINRGVIPFDLLQKLKAQHAENVIKTWFYQLKQNLDASIEMDYLHDSLLYSDGSQWINHLKNCALILANQPESIRRYSCEEIIMITQQMQDGEQTTLSSILRKEQGTLRFGQALRLLGRIYPTDLKDILYDLESVQEMDRLMIILAKALQFCVAAHAKTDFMIIPNETDLQYLLDDIAQFGLRDVVTLLIILSAVRYPYREQGPNIEQELERLLSLGTEEERNNEQT